MAAGSKTRAGERARVRDPASTRARILAEAERLFAERGFEGVSMPAIAHAAGITPGAIYRHFEGKAELFFHVIRRAVDEAGAHSKAAAQGGAAATPAMVAGYAAGPLRRLRQMAIEVHSAAAKDPQVRQLLRRSIDRDLMGIANGFAVAQAAGAMEPGPDPHLLATAVMVFIMGQMHLETIAPHLVGNADWETFVQTRIAAMLGL